MSEKKLLNCPFCGGDAVTAEMYNTKLKKLFPIVKCLDCECRTPMTETFEEAITAWNTRKPMESILEHLKRKKNPTLLLGPSWLSREERISQQKGYCKAFEEAIEIVKEEGGIE